MTRLTTPGSYLNAMRTEAPLVQNIANFVAMNIAPNVLLAAGASPAMVHSAEEAGEFAAFAGALTINIGTLSPEWVDGMLAAAESADAAGTPWIFDPVAHFATAYRRHTTRRLMALRPTVIRGNASEILALAGSQVAAKGVDSRDPVELAGVAAREVAIQHQCIVAATGAVDYVTDGKRGTLIEGGSHLMPQVTALGCALTALVGAYNAVQGADPFDATVAALAHYAVAGQAAGRGAEGPGSFGVLFLDQLAAVNGVRLDAEARVQIS
jgi:hydroxyethylthiazole kinase